VRADHQFPNVKPQMPKSRTLTHSEVQRIFGARGAVLLIMLFFLHNSLSKVRVPRLDTNLQHSKMSHQFFGGYS
jgi:hypothetical protein